ncbi:retrovirus-related pol polyprotein from transposon TNT 1-94 [Tanacetum coccineum]
MFLCSSEHMFVNCHMPHVQEDEELQLGHIYFIMPISKLYKILTLQELCLLAIKASVALDKKYSSSQMKKGGGGGGRTTSFNGRRKGKQHKLVDDKKPDLTFFRVFGALCYPTNDSEDLGKLQPTADIGIFIGYAPSRKGYRFYNKRTRRIMETIQVQFDELTEQMAPVQLSTGLAPTFLMPRQIRSGLVPNPVPTTPYVPPHK